MTYNSRECVTSEGWAAPRVCGNSPVDNGHGRNNPAPDASPSPVTTGDFYQASVSPARR